MKAKLEFCPKFSPKRMNPIDINLAINNMNIFGTYFVPFYSTTVLKKIALLGIINI